MTAIYDFGISQEDALTEHRALDISDGDRLLCISSAGEVPLNLLALNDIKITAVDISPNQNHLTRLKLHAVNALEPTDAAKFLGFTRSTNFFRKRLFRPVLALMVEKEKLFWKQNMDAIENGVVHAARFEKYIRKFNRIAPWIIGKKKLYRLLELDTIDEQRIFFDKKINSCLLKKLFQIAFHPIIYKNRGIAAEGMVHNKYKNVAEYFFNQFRDFCSSTLARKNYYLQFTFFNEVLFPEAMPEYLTEKGVGRIRMNNHKLQTHNMSYHQALQKCKTGEFNKYHLSNIGDWMGKTEFAELLRLINERSAKPGRMLFRHIYYKHPIPDDLRKSFVEDELLGEQLREKDRYPFYGLVPVKINKRQKNELNETRA